MSTQDSDDKREALNAYHRAWHAAHPEKYAEYARRLRERHPDKVKARKRRYYLRHKEKVAAANKRWREQNPEKYRQQWRNWAKRHPKRAQAHARKKRYGLLPEAYAALLQAQHNCCAICLTPMTTTTRGLVVDHCHTQRRVRGLLCDGCNVGLGGFKDDPAALRRAAEYVEQHS